MAAATISLAVIACSEAPREGCGTVGSLETVCGFENPEDLAVVDGAVVVSQMRRDGKGGSISLWEEGKATPARLWPGDRLPGIAAGPAAGDPGCPPPDPDAFAPHGVFAAPPGLWVVNHGGRESIEIFSMSAAADGFVARWLGCVEMPAGTSANDVAVGPRGEVLASNMSAPGAQWGRALKSRLGLKTGDVVLWRAGKGWQHLPNSRASAPNGVAISPDGRWLYFAESGAGRVVRVRPDGSAREEIEIPGRPDNLAWGPDGTLYVAAHHSSFELARCLWARPCRSGWSVFAIEPNTRRARLLLEQDGEHLGAVATAQPFGDRVLLSAVFDDRIGIWDPRVGHGASLRPTAIPGVASPGAKWSLRAMAEGDDSLEDGSLDDALLDEVREERRNTLSGPDSPEGRALGKAVGENVARLRAERGLALDALARRSGIRSDLLETLEGGHAVPSLRAVWHLATGLEVPFGSLLAHTMLTAAGDPDFRVQRAARGRVIASSTNQFQSRVLFLEGDPRAPEVYDLTLQPGCVETAQPHAAETFETIVVTSGSMVVRANDSETTLEAGENVFFRADVPHAYENPGPDPCRAILVMSYAKG